MKELRIHFIGRGELVLSLSETELRGFNAWMAGSYPVWQWTRKSDYAPNNKTYFIRRDAIAYVTTAEETPF